MSDWGEVLYSLGQEEFNYLTIINSVNFVDSLAAAHTMGIERAGRKVRAKMPRMKEKNYSQKVISSNLC
ncbi:hypothetical protein HZS_47 [Henneguya salminicola]|nr:hypothetical protein HZS_47 [Henneguya salminicola]